MTPAATSQTLLALNEVVSLKNFGPGDTKLLTGFTGNLWTSSFWDMEELPCS